MTVAPDPPAGDAGGGGAPGRPAPAKAAGTGQNSPAEAFELAPLGRSAGGAPIRLFRVPGASARTALILAGVHGSERSGVEVAWRALARIAAAPPAGWTVYAVPCLFPDNHAAGLREGAVPTNRNFPWPGEGLAGARDRGLRAGVADQPLDSLGVPILPENRALIALIGRIKPERLASLHATKYPERAGIFADPHGVPDDDGSAGGGNRAASIARAALRSRADADLALAMARRAGARGARVAGNGLDGTPSALWSGETPAGTSLGGWAPAPVIGTGAEDRPAISLITVEVDGLAASAESPDPAARAVELEAHADAIASVFLAP